MKIKATCYHLRKVSDGQKCCGGTIPRGMTLEEAAEWLVRDATLTVTATGKVHLLYGGTPVWAYLSVDPEETDKGRAALEEWRLEREWRIAKEAEQNRDREAELENLIDSVGIDEAIRVLSEGIQK